MVDIRTLVVDPAMWYVFLNPQGLFSVEHYRHEGASPRGQFETLSTADGVRIFFEGETLW